MAKRIVSSGPRVFEPGSAIEEVIPGNPTEVSAASEQVKGRTRVRVKYKPPVVENGFAGVHVYLEKPARGVGPAGPIKLGELVLGQAALRKDPLDLGKFPYDPAALDEDGFFSFTVVPDQDPPITNTQWRVYVPPYSATYDTELIEATVIVGPELVTPSPNDVFDVASLDSFGVGEEFAPRVRDLALTVIGPDWVSGQWQYKLFAQWTDPTPESVPDRYEAFNGVEIEIVDIDQRSSRTRLSKGTHDWASEYRPVPRAQSGGSLRVHSVSQQGDVNTYAAGVTPEKTFQSPAYPSVADVTNFSVIAGYGYHPRTGLPVLILAPYFDLPEDDNFAYIQFRVRPGPSGTSWVDVGHPWKSAAVEPGARALIEEQYFPADGLAVDWQCAAVSVGIDGIVKWPDPQDPGTSPQATASIPALLGGSGEQYCENPTNVQCEIVYPEDDPDGDGIANYGFRFRCTASDDPRYAGFTPVAIDLAGRHIPLGLPGREDPAVWQYTDTWSIHNETDFTVWFPGRDASGRTNGNNSYAPPIPAVTVQLRRQGGGKLNPTRFNPDKIDGNVYYNNAGKFSLKVSDSTRIGIGVNGLELNGVDMGKALAGTYDAAVFGAAGGVFQQVAVRLGSIVAGSYDPQLFSTPAGVFKLKYGGQFTQTASGLEVGQIDAGIINTGILRVGNATAGSPTYMGVYNGGSLVGWVGVNGGIIGGWMKEFYVGGTSPANAKIYCDAAGNAYFSGNIGATSMTSGTFNVGKYNNSAATGVYAYQWNGSANVLVGWMGANGLIVGGWMKEFYIGGNDPATAKIYCDAAGNAVFTGSILASQIASAGTLSGVKLTLNTGGVTSQVDTLTDGLFNFAGFRVTENSSGALFQMGPFLIRHTWATSKEVRIGYWSLFQSDPAFYVSNSSGAMQLTPTYCGSSDTSGSSFLRTKATAVSAPSGGATVDTEARTAINALIDRFKNHHAFLS